jgi:hypothetical protein
MMQSAPLVLGISGLLFLGIEIWATRANRQRFLTRPRRQRIAFWICMSVAGIALVYVSLIGQYDLRPNLRIFGIPFMSAVWEFERGKWIDFTGPLTLPALMGNAAVAFLLPQLIAAGAMRVGRRH